jgi:hypothetical protein
MFLFVWEIEILEAVTMKQKVTFYLLLVIICLFRLVISYKSTDVSDERTGSIFSVEKQAE